jgi:cytochrome c-type biogenesis protein
MNTGVNIGIAFAAGVLSFLSPCILPLIPAYLSLMAGTTLQDLRDRGGMRKSALLNTVFFVIGFSIIFMALGILFTSTFALLSGIGQIINIVAGAIVIILGLNFIFNFWNMLNIEKRFHLQNRPTSLPASLLFGMAFGAGWSPCIGPILSSILFLAGTSGSLGRGIILLSVYSIGLGLPFLLTALFLPAALRQMDRIKKHLNTIKIVSGILLIAVGLLIALGRLQKFNTILFSAAYRLESWEQAYPNAARGLFGAVFFLFAAAVGFFYIRRIQKDRSGNLATVPDQPGDAVPAGSTAQLTRHRKIRPIRIGFFLLFLTVSILSAAGILNFSELLSSWFNFQGL